MISATRIYISEYGYDPRNLFLFAFGGAGPIHAHAIAKALKMPGFIVPSSAGVASSLGFLSSPPSFEFSKTYISVLNNKSLKTVKKIFKTLENDNKNKLKGFNKNDLNNIIYSLNLRHVGQGHDINLEIKVDEITFNENYIKNKFFSKYTSIYGYAHKHLNIEITLCKVVVKAKQPNFDLKKDQIENELFKKRKVKIYDGKKYIDYQNMNINNLKYNHKYNGPSVIQSIETTCIIPKNSSYLKDENNNIIVKFDNS